MSRAGYEFAMQDPIEEEGENLQNLFEGRARARKKKGRAGDANIYFSLPIGLLKRMDDCL